MKESKDDKQGHELSSNLLLQECVPELGEKPGCLGVDKQISVVVEGKQFVEESSGVRDASPGDRRKHQCLPHCLPQHAPLSALCSLSAKPVCAIVFWVNKLCFVSIALSAVL